MHLHAQTREVLASAVSKLARAAGSHHPPLHIFLRMINTPAQDTLQVSHTVEHLFRHESGKIIGTLVRIFGLEHLTLAEDVLQEALSRALQTWPYRGIPENPSAWIMRASRNLALDAVRRESNFKGKKDELLHSIQLSSPALDTLPDGQIADDRLRLIFVCCHPVIPPESQIALALKTLCGFSPAEIAKAFLTSEAAINKRLTRAKQKIREAHIPFEIPEGETLAQRLDTVLQSLYLLFNEGYKASTGDILVREDVCREAVRLARLLLDHPVGRAPGTHALLALMLFNTARTPARFDTAGNLLRLQEQDRARWDRGLIAQGMFHLAQSAAGPHLTPYHLQAAIAACHCTAADYPSTDWTRILDLYDHLIHFDNSPVVALNRAVALAEIKGPAAGLDAICTIPNIQDLQDYYLLHAVLGELEARSQNLPMAATHFRRALELAEIKSEKTFLTTRLESCSR